MPTRHEVRPGDCISSIAFQYGLHPDTVWDDPANAKLRRQRESPNVLQPGDELVVPDKRLKEESHATEARHRFRRRGMPELLRLQLLDCGKPRANLQYTLDIDGRLLDGCTDEDGYLEHWIAPDARRGKLVIGREEEYELDLGHLSPPADERGYLARLVNLQYLETDTANEEDIAAAIESFQADYGLDVTGEMDDPTREALREAHDS